MHHVAVALHSKCLRHLHRAGLGDAADVVARQVDQHHVLGTLLGIVHQFLLGRLVLLGRSTARARASQRTDGDLVAFRNRFVAHQDFGARAHHLEVAEVVVVHVRRGVQRTQRAVQRQRAFRVALVDALADLHLHEVASGDQLLGLGHGLQVVVFGKAALGGMVLGGTHDGRAHRILELFLQLAQPLLALGIGLGLRRIGIDDQVELARQVVDDGQFLALQQQDVGAAQRVVGAAVFELFLDVAHRVVAEVTGQATAKARQSGAQRDLETLLVISDEVERIALGRLHHLAVGDHLGLCRRAKAAGAQQRARRQADEAVATKALAADHRFQQKAVGAVATRVGEFEVEGQRSFKVRKGFGNQRNTVVAFRSQTFEFKFCNHR
ncbi:hypothetical protein SDC9_83504 [bioreactor metagenome]|uniref:NAD-specific glutamate dehydrogenase n=1 Tax=bioreactor metagenome TaxID=1076179 RepID=A0A644Z7Q9_9ZZZZ